MKWILICFAASAVAVTDFGVLSANDNTLHFDKENHKVPLNSTPPWISIGEFISSNGDDCPGVWEKYYLRGRYMCRSTVVGCLSHFFSSEGRSYNEIYGYVVGYQKGYTSAFSSSHSGNINNAYLDGVSITIRYPRQHVWTYAAGQTKEGNYPDFNCPCSAISGPSAPIFVRDHYYCSSGAGTQAEMDDFYGPLWQGKGCSVNDGCCTDVGLPYFYRRLPTIENAEIEVRICNNQPFSKGSVLIDELRLNVRLN